MLVQRGHTYAAAARIPGWVPLSVVRNKLLAAGFVNVSVRSADGANYNVVGQGTWTGPDQDVDLPSEVVWAHDITPAAEAPPPPDAGAPEAGPLVLPSSPSPTPPSAPSPPPVPHRRRRRAPVPSDPSVPIVAAIVSGIGALVLWRLKKDGFWNRRAWR